MFGDRPRRYGERPLALFRPEHSLILNIEEEHLDFYAGIEEINAVFTEYSNTYYQPRYGGKRRRGLRKTFIGKTLTTQWIGARPSKVLR